MLTPLHVITVVFNPRRFNSRHRLYTNFADWVSKHNVPLVTVEVAFGDRPHTLTDPANPWHLQLRTRDELWHKERALNLGMQHLCKINPKWQYVAWMDADIKLQRDDWPTETVHLLQHYAVLQMFGEARHLDPDHHQIYNARSIMRNFEEHGGIDWYDHPGLTFRDRKNTLYQSVRGGHPGLAWAFRRTELEQVGGLLDVCVNGSGDLHMAGCFTGRSDLALPAGISPGYRDAIARYGARCETFIRRNCSYMSGAADHFWHGKSKTRGYEDRGNLLITHQYDPATDIVVDLQGLYRWHMEDSRVRALAADTRKSLRRRNEDSVDM